MDAREVAMPLAMATLLLVMLAAIAAAGDCHLVADGDS